MPGMVELARGGVVFSNAFASSNLCAPSRSGLLMGRLQNRYGLYQNTDVEKPGPRGAVLAERLQQAGYATGFIGKWHAGRRDESLREGVFRKHNLTRGGLARLAPEQRKRIDRELAGTGYIGSAMPEYHPLKNGFDYYFGYNHYQCPFYNSEEIWENWTYTGLQERYNTELFTDKAVQFIRGARKQAKPFFLQVSFHAMHGPLQPKAPERYFNKFPSPSRDLTNFYAHVNAVDEGVAAIRRELGEEWANTLFVFTADNGAPLSMQSPLPGNAPSGATRACTSRAASGSHAGTLAGAHPGRPTTQGTGIQPGHHAHGAECRRGVNLPGRPGRPDAAADADRKGRESARAPHVGRHPCASRGDS